MTSYQLSIKYKINHREMLARISNIANVFDGEIMQFECRGGKYFMMNNVAYAFMMLLLEEE